MPMSRRASIAAILAGAVVLLAGAAALSFGPLVRRAVSQRAERYGATVTVDHVRPTLSGVRLEGIQVRLADGPNFAITFAQVLVEGGRLGPVDAVHVVGGELRASGEPEVLANELRAVVARGARGTGAGRSTPIDVAGVSARWERSPGGDGARASDLSLRREGGVVFVGAGSFSTTGLGANVSGTGAQIELARADGGWQIRSLEATSCNADVTLANASPARTSTGKSEPERFGEKIARWRARAGHAAVALAQAVAEGAKLRIGETSLVLHRDAEVLHAGPGELRVSIEAGTASVSFVPTHGGLSASPLELSAVVPLDATRELALAVRGGPVSLATLGFRDGDMGLLDVAKATVEAGGKLTLSGDAKHVEVSMQGKLRALAVRHPKLSSQPVHGLDAAFAAKGGADLDGANVRVDRLDLDVGTVHAEVSGELRRAGDGFRVDGKAAVPLASCQGMLDALPAGLAPKLAGMTMAGTFAIQGKIAFDSRHADASAVGLTLLDECKVTHAPPAVDVARFRAPYRRLVYAPDGTRVEVETGPGTPGWVPFGAISPFMEVALLTTEDGAFRRHRGFDVEALRNSIRENLKAGRFVRGGSTISMQTAKNVYLERDKTLARKLEEAILTSYLEQVLSKEQILELYLNSIEFGPMIYGIGPAAAHYFHTSAAELSLGQALYLSSILPNPKVQHFGEGGRVSAGWMGYLHRLMRGMVKRRLLSEGEVAEGLTEWVVFGVPRPPRVRPNGDPMGPDDLPPVDPEDRLP